MHNTVYNVDFELTYDGTKNIQQCTESVVCIRNVILEIHVFKKKD